MRIEGDRIQRSEAPPPPPPTAAADKPKGTATGAPPGDGVDKVRSHETAGAPAATITKQQADKDAKALYDATEGGLTGWGTDEDVIWKTLEGKSKADLDVIRASYKDHYGKDLDKVLRGEVGGKDREHLDALLKGKDNQSEVGAVRISAELDGAFGDAKEVLKTLEKASPSERHALAESYAKKYGAPADQPPEQFLLERIERDPKFSPTDRERARTLLAASAAKTPEEARRLEAEANATRVHDAIAGLGTDEGALRKTLGGMSRQQIDDMGAAYKVKYGDDLRARLGEELSGADRDEILALYDHGKEGGGKREVVAERDAARIKRAVDGAGTDEDAIRGILGGKSKQEIDELAAAYEKKYGHDLRARLGDETGGAERDEILSLFDGGKDAARTPAKIAERDAARIKQAVDGAGTDEAAIRDILSSKSKPEIDEMARVYQQRYGHDLRARLAEELGGREKVELVHQLFDHGKIDPDSPGANEERLRRLEEQREVEGGFGLWLTSKVQKATKGESDDDRLALNLERARLAGPDKDRAARLIGYAEGDLDSMKTSKDSAAEWAATGGAVVLSTAVVVGTGGAATPLVIGAAAAAGAAGGAGGYALVQGGAADSTDIARQALIGGATGATAFVGAGATAAKQTAGTAIKQTAGAAVKQPAAGAVRPGIAETLKEGAKQGAKAGAAGGAADGATRSATESDTWKDGLAPGFLKVIGETATGAVVGGTLGAGTGVALKGGGAATQALRDRIQLTRQADELATTLEARIKTQASDRAEPKFKLEYSRDDLRAIIKRGNELGLSPQQIEDFTFVGSRIDKRLDAAELTRQMDNYVNVVKPRGYPHNFASPEAFANFKEELLTGLRDDVGLPTDDVRIQGSALRTPRAKDVDVAIMLSQADFEATLLDSFTSKHVARLADGTAIPLQTMTREERLTLAKAVLAEKALKEADPSFEFSYNGNARTWAHAEVHGKMRYQDVEGLRAFAKSLQRRHGDLDVSVMSREGNFDMEPFMRLD